MTTDWKFWIFVLQALVIFVNLVTFFAIKFNDFRHLRKQVEELDKKILNLTASVVKLGKDIVKINTRCEERSKLFYAKKNKEKVKPKEG